MLWSIWFQMNSFYHTILPLCSHVMLCSCVKKKISGTSKCINILVQQIFFSRHSLQMWKCYLEQPLGYFLHQLPLITCLSANSGQHSVIYFKVNIIIQHNAFFVGAGKIHVLTWLAHFAPGSDMACKLFYQMVNF